MSFISDLLIEISSFRIRVGNKLNTLATRIGNLSSLSTAHKTDLVGAINEVNSKTGDYIPYIGANKAINFNTQSFTHEGIFLKSRTHFDRKLFTISETSTGSNYIKLTDVASLSRPSDSTTLGDIVISFPIVSSTSWTLEIDIQQANITSLPAKLIISGYGTSFSARKVHVLAGFEAIHSVEFGRVNDNNIIIIKRSDVPTSFSYGKVNLVTFYHSVSPSPGLFDKSNFNINFLVKDEIVGYTYHSTILNKDFKRDPFLLDFNNFTNVPNFALNSTLANYLPLSGGTMTGTINLNKSWNQASLFKDITTESNPSYGFALMRGRNSNSDKGVGISTQGDLMFGEWASVTNLSTQWNKLYHSGNLTKLSQLTNDLGFVTTDTKYTSSSGIALVGNDFRPTYGTAVNTIAQGNDSRINNGQTAFSWGNHASAGYLKLADLNGYATESWVTTQLSSKANTNGSNVNGTWNNLTSGDSIKLGGQLPAYYLNYNNLTNTPPPIDISGKANVDGGNITNVAQWKQKLVMTLQDVTSNGNTSENHLNVRGVDNIGDTTNILTYKLFLSNYGDAYGMKFSVFGSGVGVIQQGRTNTNEAYTLSLNPFGGNVGVGEIDAQAKLHVDGNAIVANATEPNHAVTLEQLNNSASPYRYFQDNIFSDTPNFSNNTINGKGNQALGSYILHRGSRSTLIGDHIVSEGNYINAIGRRGSFSGGYINSYGAYNTATGAHINLYGNYLTGSKSNYTAIGNYNKFDLINPEKEQNKVVVIGSGKSEYERENAIEIFTDNSSGFRGKAFYDEETRNPEWFGEQGTLVDTTVAGMHHLEDRAISYNLDTVENLIGVCDRGFGTTYYKSISGDEECLCPLGIVDGLNFGGGLFNPNKVHRTGTIKYNIQQSHVLSEKFAIDYGSAYLVVIYTADDRFFESVRVLDYGGISQQRNMGRMCRVLGSFIKVTTPEGPQVYFEFNHITLA